MTAVNLASSDPNELIAALISAIKELSLEMSEMRQYINADFEVVNLRFDRLEDRLDRFESNLIYEH